MKQTVKNELLQLTQLKDSEGIKSLLESLDKGIKGNIFEWYLAELYKGNGWLVKVQGGRGDLGADILRYHPKTPSKTFQIIQAKNHLNPLTFDQTKIELVKFEQQASSKYNCQQFMLVAVNGFVGEAQKLSAYNIDLSGWEYVANLVERFDPDNIAEPEIELFPHNNNAYEQAKELWLDGRYVAVVQATGTGKSILIAKVLAGFLGENSLVMAPSHYILDQQKTKAPWAMQSTTFMTYAKGANLTNDEIKELDVKLIVLDEFHRCGAEVWGVGVQRLLDAFPKAYVFGTTATPIRYLDSSRDISDELFGGAVAVDLSLAEAIIKKILPSPDYVAALYTLDEEIENLMETLEKSNKPDEEKKKIVTEINQAKLNWEQTSGIPQILKKHLKSDSNKFIVFCNDQEHLDKMEVEVQKWFQRAGTHRWRKVYRVLSADPESDSNLNDFKNARSSNTAHLLFAINKLNEGLHISDVGAVILLRFTESPNIFYQQIGRCIHVGIEHTPIIFDFVNNFQNIRANDFWEDLEEARDNEREKRAVLGLAEYAPVVHITDETKDILEVFERVSAQLLPWEVMFQQLAEFRKAHGHCNVPDRWPENPQLGKWVSKLSSRRKKGKLSKGRIRRLDEIGVIWDRLEANWEEMFSDLLEFKKTHGHCNVPSRWPKNPKLSKWVSHHRSFWQKGQLSEERIKRLEDIGFIWEILEANWEEMLTALVEFKEVHGHCNVPRDWIENPKLSKWVSKQRSNWKKGELSEERTRRMEQVDFIWDRLKGGWEEMFSALLEFKEAHDHCNVPDKWPENPQLGNWASHQRIFHKKGKLNEERVLRLDEIGFSWDPIVAAWEEMFAALVEFKKVHGHCNVPRGWIENPKLSRWIPRQRTSWKRGELSEERTRRMEEIGFEWLDRWDIEVAMWEKMFSELLEFKKAHGHCNVPRGWAENSKLGIWVGNQRRARKKNKLNKERVRRLQDIGFTWNRLEENWEEMFAALVEFKEAHGHCDVSISWSENPKLGIWVGNQRSARRKNKLNKERVRRLQDIGFTWNPLEANWEEMFAALLEFKEAYGHCNVKSGWSMNPKLSKWVSHQRSFQKKGRLSEKRIKRLNGIGFQWKIRSK